MRDDTIGGILTSMVGLRSASRPVPPKFPTPMQVPLHPPFAVAPARVPKVPPASPPRVPITPPASPPRVPITPPASPLRVLKPPSASRARAASTAVLVPAPEH